MRKFILFVGFMLIAPPVFGAEVYLSNGDRVSGEILERSSSGIKINSEILGALLLDNQHIEKVVDPTAIPEPEPEVKEVEWKTAVSAGYNRTAGNTKTQEGMGKIFINRRRPKVDEYTARAEVFVSSRDRKMNARRYSGSLRYAFSFGKEKEWYNFYNIAGSHDRFANIDARITPTIGIGYWFSDQAPLKAMTELGVGVEHTKFRGTTDDRTELILTPRLMIEKELWDRATIREDLTIFPSLTEGGARIHSETALTSSLTEKTALRVSLINDYNSNAADDTKKNDLRLISSIVYKFDS